MAFSLTGWRTERVGGGPASARESAIRRPSASALMLRRARDAAIERAAIGGCLALAVATGAWAAYAIAGSPNGYDVRQIVPPIANGFAWKKTVAPVRNAAIDLDPLTTGSLPEPPRPEISAATPDGRPAGLTKAYVLRRVSEGTALVEGPSGLRQIVPGAVLPGAGRVISIRQTGAGWVIVTSETIIGPTPL